MTTEGKGHGIVRDPEAPLEGKRQSVKTVYSIGYGLRSQEGFTNTLEMLGVDTVIDVRSIPKSRFAPQFNADDIYGALQDRGISFFLAGDKLGPRPTDTSMYGENGQVDWERLREGDGYKEAIEAIKEMAGDGQLVAIVCTEGDPLSSHRFGTVSRDLAEAGMEVKHILPNGEVVSHAEMEGRLLKRYTEKGLLSTAMTGSYHEQVIEAYRVMNDQKGYKPKHLPRSRRYVSKVKL